MVGNMPRADKFVSHGYPECPGKATLPESARGPQSFALPLYAAENTGAALAACETTITAASIVPTQRARDADRIGLSPSFKFQTTQ
jgi:hypothetical protein